MPIHKLKNIAIKFNYINAIVKSIINELMHIIRNNYYYLYYVMNYYWHNNLIIIYLCIAILFIVLLPVIIDIINLYNEV